MFHFHLHLFIYLCLFYVLYVYVFCRYHVLGSVAINIKSNQICLFLPPPSVSLSPSLPPSLSLSLSLGVHRGRAGAGRAGRRAGLKAMMEEGRKGDIASVDVLKLVRVAPVCVAPARQHRIAAPCSTPRLGFLLTSLHSCPLRPSSVRSSPLPRTRPLRFALLASGASQGGLQSGALHFIGAVT